MFETFSRWFFFCSQFWQSSSNSLSVQGLTGRWGNAQCGIGSAVVVGHGAAPSKSLLERNLGYAAPRCLELPSISSMRPSLFSVAFRSGCISWNQRIVPQSMLLNYYSSP
jgi:hypothetical protein